MKQSGYLLVLVVGLLSCASNPSTNAQPISSNQPMVHAIPMMAAPPPAQGNPTNQVSINTILKWDSESKEVTVTNGTPETHFLFHLTNVWTGDIILSNVHASCGCTTAKLPPLPWRIAPGTNGEISVTMNLAGKLGAVPKSITILSDAGVKMIFVKTTILPPPAPVQMTAGEREGNQKLAQTDRQAVFKGDCARCHSNPDKNKMGQPLYVSVCGVCHEAEHRATMVPNLHAIAQETNAEFWRNWITYGKVNTLMPAFSEKQGGVLTEPQIESLVTYLTAVIPSKPQTQASKPEKKAL